MKPRFDYAAAAPGAYKAMRGLEQYLHECGLDEQLMHIIKLRATKSTAAPTASTCTGKICAP